MLTAPDHSAEISQGIRNGDEHYAVTMINVKVRTTPKNLAKLIDQAPRMARGRMVVAAAEELIAEQYRGRRGLWHYPKYKHITRKQAFGQTFQSDRQRRFVMASLRAGYNLKTGRTMEPGYPHRTGRLQRGWFIVAPGGQASKASIRNTEDYADFVMGDKDQSRMMKLIGWRTVSQVAEDMEKSMVNAAEKEMQAYLNEKGIGI